MKLFLLLKAGLPQILERLSRAPPPKKKEDFEEGTSKKGGFKRAKPLKLEFSIDFKRAK